MFNGTFICYSNNYHYLSIVYDGENWNFKSFIYNKGDCYCTSCRDPENIFETTIREGQIIPACSRTQVFFCTEDFKFDVKFKVEDLEEGTSALVFHEVGKRGNTTTSLIKSSDGNLVVYIPVLSKDQNILSDEIIFLPANVSVEEKVAAAFASSVVCYNEYSSDLEDPDDDAYSSDSEDPDGDEYNSESEDPDGDKYNSDSEYPDNEYNSDSEDPDGDEYNSDSEYPDDEYNSDSEDPDDDEYNSDSEYPDDEYNSDSEDPDDD